MNKRGGHCIGRERGGDAELCPPHGPLPAAGFVAAKRGKSSVVSMLPDRSGTYEELAERSSLRQYFTGLNYPIFSEI